MSGFSSILWCVTSAACAGWMMVNGLLPSLPLSAAGLCCTEQLEGYGVFL